MSASNEHQHVCTRCGNTFNCWCSNEYEQGDERMCNGCAAQYRRIRDAHWPRGVHFRRPNDFGRRR